MLNSNMHKHEIEQALQVKGDFYQIDMLTRLLEQELPLDIKKFSYLKLAEIYEKKSMFRDAAKMYNSLAIFSIAFSEKIKNHVREAEMYLKAGLFDDLHKSVQKAMNQANASQKQEIFIAVRDAYKKQGEIYEMQMKRRHAVDIYEKLLEMNLTDLEKQEIRDKLVMLYEKLGKFHEVQRLKGLENKKT